MWLLMPYLAAMAAYEGARQGFQRHLPRNLNRPVIVNPLSVWVSVAAGMSGSHLLDVLSTTPISPEYFYPSTTSLINWIDADECLQSAGPDFQAYFSTISLLQDYNSAPPPGSTGPVFEEPYTEIPHSFYYEAPQPPTESPLGHDVLPNLHTTSQKMSRRERRRLTRPRRQHVSRRSASSFAHQMCFFMYIAASMAIVAVFGHFDAYKKGQRSRILDNTQQTGESYTTRQGRQARLGSAVLEHHAEMSTSYKARSKRQVRLGSAVLQHHAEMSSSFYTKHIAFLEATISKVAEDNVSSQTQHVRTDSETCQACKAFEQQITDQKAVMHTSDMEHNLQLSEQQDKNLALQLLITDIQEAHSKSEAETERQVTDLQAEMRSKDISFAEEQSRSSQLEKQLVKAKEDHIPVNHLINSQKRSQDPQQKLMKSQNECETLREVVEEEQEDTITLGTAPEPASAHILGLDEAFLDPWDKDGAGSSATNPSPNLTCPEVIVFTDPKLPRKVHLGIALLKHHAGMGRSFYLKQSASLDSIIRTKDDALVYFQQRCTDLEEQVMVVQEENRQEKGAYVGEQENLLRDQDQTHKAELSAEQKKIVTLGGQLAQAEESLLAKDATIAQQITDHETALRFKDAALSGEQQKSLKADKGLTIAKAALDTVRAEATKKDKEHEAASQAQAVALQEIEKSLKTANDTIQAQASQMDDLTRASAALTTKTVITTTDTPTSPASCIRCAEDRSNMKTSKTADKVKNQAAEIKGLQKANKSLKEEIARLKEAKVNSVIKTIEAQHTQHEQSQPEPIANTATLHGQQAPFAEPTVVSPAPREILPARKPHAGKESAPKMSPAIEAPVFDTKPELSFATTPLTPFAFVRATQEGFKFSTTTRPPVPGPRSESKLLATGSSHSFGLEGQNLPVFGQTASSGSQSTTTASPASFASSLNNQPSSHGAVLSKPPAAAISPSVPAGMEPQKPLPTGPLSVEPSNNTPLPPFKFPTPASGGLFTQQPPSQSSTTPSQGIFSFLMQQSPSPLSQASSLSDVKFPKRSDVGDDKGLKSSGAPPSVLKRRHLHQLNYKNSLTPKDKTPSTPFNFGIDNEKLPAPSVLHSGPLGSTAPSTIFGQPLFGSEVPSIADGQPSVALSKAQFGPISFLAQPGSSDGPGAQMTTAAIEQEDAAEDSTAGAEGEDDIKESHLDTAKGG